LQRSEREEELAERLEEHGVEDAWEMVEMFVDAGLTADDLDDLAGQIAEPVRAMALTWSACGLSAARMVADIESSTARISELVSSIKTYSHMDRSPEHRPTDVREGLDNTLTMLSHKLKKKNVQLERDYQEDLPSIPANAGELNQVWTNLIDNALDALEEGGSLRVVARAEGGSVSVRLIDDGPGIPEEILARIFEPFFTTKGVGQGTGLGLDIALRIAKTHQGGIEVRSKPGRTEMCVRLPIRPVAAPRESADVEKDG
jgi:signal transduction histidine kinase